MKRRRVYLGLGSNYGDRFAFLQQACDLCSGLPETDPVSVSSVYETSPVGLREQPAFYNAVLCIETSLAPEDLLHRLKSMERQIGRKDRGRWAMREIDIDILLDGEAVIDRGPVIVPHPRMHERKFVLVPLAEIAPDERHPVAKVTVRELLERCTSDETVTGIHERLQIHRPT